MRRWDPEAWSSVFVTLVCVFVGVVQLGNAEVARLPGWWICFAAFCCALLICMYFVGLLPRRVVLTAFAAQVLLGPALVLMAPRAGWTPILLVFTAAISAYLLPLRTTAAVIAFNTLVVAAVPQMQGGSGEALLAALLYLLLQLGSALGVVAQAREARMRQKLAEAHTELRTAGALLAESTRADERLRIARELHDLLGHQLTVLALELEVASHQATPPASEHVARARRLAGDLLADVRTTVGELRRRAPDLRDTLERIVAELPEPVVHLTIDDAVEADEERTAALVRCVQEVVTNTIRHAAAGRLWIEITADEKGGLTFTARDDGRGADRIVPGNGLRGIAERAEALGGRAHFWAERGFHVVAEMPSP
ncbi:two-component sensor histidine kinase [Nonomuraea terrae]|uniref:Two-component sensor histidine kinase n=1 Tax=Nonomuraea terrae TaxID=2530383 RepID=A0A4V2YKY4_9ACTN|nr:histidine kinase [Nonomuraea terrae]TDD44637.1 two-component sensor histidine kinase [Nonomuraea terrae]